MENTLTLMQIAKEAEKIATKAKKTKKLTMEEKIELKNKVADLFQEIPQLAQNLFDIIEDIEEDTPQAPLAEITTGPEAFLKFAKEEKLDAEQIAKILKKNEASGPFATSTVEVAKFLGIDTKKKGEKVLAQAIVKSLSK